MGRDDDGRGTMRQGAGRPDGTGAPALEDVTGAVLCGGSSTRFGADKALARVGGATLLEHALDSLVPARERLLVGRDYGLAGVRFVADRRAGVGPLAGLEAALEAAATPWLALAACDLPNLTPDYWRILCARALACQAVVVRHPGDRLEPLAALYHRSVLAEVSARLDARALSMHELVRALAAETVDARAVAAACGADVLRNVNRAGDIAPEERGSGPS